MSAELPSSALSSIATPAACIGMGSGNLGADSPSRDELSKIKYQLVAERFLFLAKNISISVQLIKRLKEAGLISETMADDIWAIPETENGLSQLNFSRSKKLIEFLLQKVHLGDNFLIFLDAIEYSGHQIVASFLRSEFQDCVKRSNLSIKLKIPSYNDVELSMAYAKAIETLQNDTILSKTEQEDSILNLKILKNQLSTKDDQIAELTTLLQEKNNEIDTSAKEIRKLKVDTKLWIGKFHEVVKSEQVTTDARENYIKRLDGRMGQFDDEVRKINEKLEAFFQAEFNGIKRIKYNRESENTSYDAESDDIGENLEGLGEKTREAAINKDISRRAKNILVSTTNDYMQKLMFLHENVEHELNDTRSILHHEKRTVLEMLGKKYFGQSAERPLKEFLEKTDKEKHWWSSKFMEFYALLFEKEEIKKSNISDIHWEKISNQFKEMTEKIKYLNGELKQTKLQLQNALTTNMTTRKSSTVVAPQITQTESQQNPISKTNTAPTSVSKNEKTQGTVVVSAKQTLKPVQLSQMSLDVNVENFQFQNKPKIPPVKNMPLGNRRGSLTKSQRNL